MLTTKQMQVFDFVAEYIATNKVAPTYEQIAKALDLGSRYEVYRYIECIAKKGYIKKMPYARQGIAIIKRPQGATSPYTKTIVTNTESDALVQAAYARGVAEGKRMRAEATDAALFKLHFDKGYKKAYAELQPLLTDARDRGFAAGLRVGKKELTEKKKMLA